MKKRNINVELLRIISMLMIVYHHFSVHTKWPFGENLTPKEYFIFSIGNFGKGGVLIFILITGYFFSKQTITYKKILNLNNIVTFYSLSIFFFSLIIVPFNIKTMVSAAFPIIFDVYWFVTFYALLIIFQPFLKKYLATTYRKVKLKNWFLLVLFTYVPTLFGIVFQIDRYFIPNNIVIFILAALTGDLIKEYKNELTTKYLKLTLLVFFMSIFMLQCKPFLIKLLDNHQLHYPEYFINDTKSLTIFLFSTTFFIIFLNVKIPHKISSMIIYISSCTFEIYLIHDNPIIRNYLWNYYFKNANYYNSPLFPVIAIIDPLIVFFGCVIIILFIHFIVKTIKNMLN